MGEGETLHLDVEALLEIHAAVFGVDASVARDQLRDPGGLESACARSATYQHYEAADMALQAAALAHGIAEAQAFVDGNKRTAALAMMQFLELNGITHEVTNPELAEWILDLSDGLSVKELATRIRPRLH